MTKTKLLSPSAFGAEGSLAVVNQLNSMLEDMSRNSCWMEMVESIGGWSSGSIIPIGSPVRLFGAQSVPLYGRDDPLGAVQQATSGTREQFLGLTLDEVQSRHYGVSRILLWGRLELDHSFTHGNLVYLSTTAGTLDDSSTGAAPIGEWLNSTTFKGLQLNPSFT